MGAVKEKLIDILVSNNWRNVQEFYGGPEYCTDDEAQKIFYFWKNVFKGELKKGFELKDGKVIRTHLDE